MALQFERPIDLCIDTPRPLDLAAATGAGVGAKRWVAAMNASLTGQVTLCDDVVRPE